MEKILYRKLEISISTLKMLALIFMLTDHIAVVLSRVFINSMKMYYLTNCMHMIGRLAFPIFCFTLVVGFQYTHNIKKYILRLLLLALISEIPFDLFCFGKIIEFSRQNSVFTLLLGFVGMSGIKNICEKFKEKRITMLLSNGIFISFLALFAILFNFEYGALGVLAMVIMYIFRKKKRIVGPLLACVLLTIGNISEITSLFCLLPISIYNERRGPIMKYVFYVFYPTHLLIMYIIYLVASGQ